MALTTPTLTFADEFDAFRTWDGTAGWRTTQWYAPPGGMHPWNEEEQWYMDPTHSYGGRFVNPFSVADGVLAITAAPAPASLQPLIEGYRYTSGMISSYGAFAQQYGYFEIRAELPAGQGLWPAFWLLPASGGWPPELDVMEVLGHDPTRLHTTVHSNSTGSLVSTSAATVVPDTTAGMHTYGVDWQADRITWYMDGERLFETATPPDMHQPMYIQANLAVGGTWPGSPDATTPFPARLEIDHIRVWTSRPTDPQGLFTLPESGAWTGSFTGSKRGDRYTGTGGNEILDGRAGADTLTGGGGDDTYVVDSARDIVIEAEDGGVDTVRTALSSLALPNHVENLVLTGTAAQTGRGNDLANRLVANGVGSTLEGGWGGDILIGGAGADRLTGGRGADLFVLKPNRAGADRITDFMDGRDVLDLSAVFAGRAEAALTPGECLRVVQAGAAAEIWFDRDGGGRAAPVLVATLDGVDAARLTPGADWWV